MLCRTGHYACLELQFLCSQVYLPDIQVIPAYASIVRNFLSLEILHREGHIPELDILDVEYLLLTLLWCLRLLKSEYS